MNYSATDKEAIEKLVNQIEQDYPEFNNVQARIWEVISRYRGDAGLSAGAVSYLASCIHEILVTDLLKDLLDLSKSWNNGAGSHSDDLLYELDEVIAKHTGQPMPEFGCGKPSWADGKS
jgi:hypothetical protein